MELDVAGEEQTVMENVETVEVVASGDDVPNSTAAAAVGLMDHQHMIVSSPEGILVPTSEVQIESQTLSSQVLDPETSSFSMPGMGVVTIPVEPPTSPPVHPTQGIMLGVKRPHPDVPVTSVGLPISEVDASHGLSNSNINNDIPRKKSRNYLDSHKTIEKKRRDRINQCLESLKALVPDCRQYGSKKLDKAEILEMSIEYIQKIQNQGGVAGRGASGGLDVNLNHREWANDLTTWVINNKVLYSGPSAMDQFCQALLLHLQSMGSGNALASATSMLLNQANASSEEDALLRQQTVNAQVAILQQLQQQLGALGASMGAAAAGGGAGGKEGAAEAGGQLQQAQLTQLQALLLLQQHQQLQQQQQQHQEAESQSHQLQQLQQLQALLLQHIASEGAPTLPSATADSAQKSEEPNQQPVGSAAVASNSVTPMTGESVVNMRSDGAGSLGSTPRVELAQTEELATTEETVYTTGMSTGMDEENLIQVTASVSQTAASAAITNPASSGQMWSSAGTRQPASLLMLGGGGSESEGRDQAPEGSPRSLRPPSSALRKRKWNF